MDVRGFFVLVYSETTWYIANPSVVCIYSIDGSPFVCHGSVFVGWYYLNN